MIISFFQCLVETHGLEPWTSCVWSKRSNRLSYASKVENIISLFLFVVHKKAFAKIYNSLMIGKDIHGIINISKIVLIIKFYIY